MLHSSISNSEPISTPGTQCTWTSFAIWLFGVLCLCLLLVIGGLNWIVWRAGEFLSPAEVLVRQQATGGLYRSALTDDIMTPEFRIERYDLLKPEIIALGSSRVLQFRQSHFTRPFANMGMSLDYANLPSVARALTESPNNLKVVILTLDHWQVNPVIFRSAIADPGFRTRIRGPSAFITKYKLKAILDSVLFGPVRLLFQQRLGLNEIRSILCRCDDGGSTNNFGLAALLDGSGVDVEGSYHYTWAFEMRKEIVGFSETFKRIEDGTNGFQYASKISPDRFGLIVEATKILNDAGVRIILIIPPMAPAVVGKMRETHAYGILDDLDVHLTRLKYPYFNFHDPEVVGSDDCEFADGFHGGEVTYLRLLKRMAAEQQTDLDNYVDKKKIDQMIREGVGRINAYQIPKSGDRSRKEVDFLGLGCKR